GLPSPWPHRRAVAPAVTGPPAWREEIDMKVPRDAVARPGRRGRSVVVCAVGLTLLFAASAATAMQLTPWNAAINVESIAGTSSEFNTPYTDGCPIQSPDG